MLDTTPNGRVKHFLDKFDAALAAGDVEAVARLFAKESYWRDLVAFTWNIKTMEGRDQIARHARHCLKRVKPRDWRVAEGETATEADGVLEVLDFIRNRNRPRLWPHPHQGRPDLDPADDNGRAQGP